MPVNYSFFTDSIAGEHAGTFPQQENAGEQLRIVGTDLMQHGPETRFGWRRRQGERRGAEIDRDLGAEDGDDHLCDKIKRRDAGEQPEQQQQAAEDLRYRDEMCREPGQGKTQRAEPAYALVGINEFQQPFPKKDTAGDQADPKDGAGAEYGRV